MLDMHTKFPEGSQTFRRNSEVEEKLEFTSSAVAWGNVLTGKALDEFNAKIVPKYLRKKNT